MWMYSEPFSVEFYRGLSSGFYSLAFQPIVSSEGSSVLYLEGLIRDRGNAFAIHPVVHLERFGRVRLLDSAVVSTVVETIRNNEQVTIGCNISAQSAAMDSGWKCLQRYLRIFPNIADRLLIEITETARAPNQSQVLYFMQKMRALGCKIAIDDFGSGHTELEFLKISRPDVVKVDRRFLVQARDNKVAAKQLMNLRQECEYFSPTVVLEGVETAADYELALQAGFRWLQGFYFGMPHLNPPQIPAGCLLRM